MKNIKRISSLVLAFALMLSFTMSAFAAPSPTVNVKATKVMVNGKSIDISKLKITKTKVTVDPATVDPSLKNMAIAYAVDVSLDGVDFDEVSITFAIPSIQKDENVKVLHLQKDDKWEVLTPESVEDQEVTVTFKSLSPVLFLVDKK